MKTATSQTSAAQDYIASIPGSSTMTAAGLAASAFCEEWNYGDLHRAYIAAGQTGRRMMAAHPEDAEFARQVFMASGEPTDHISSTDRRAIEEALEMWIDNLTAEL